MKILSFAPAYLIPMLAMLVGIYVITRILPPEQYGMYALVMSLMALCQAALFSWLDIGAKRFYERVARTGQMPVLNTTIYLGMGLSTIAFLGICLAGFSLVSISPSMQTLLWIGAAVVLARQLAQISKVFELATLSRTRYMIMECGETIVGVAAGLALCWFAGMGPAGILLGMLVGAAVVVLFDVSRTRARLRGGRFDPQLQRQVIGFGAPIALAFLVEYIAASSDRLLVQFFLGSDALGLYAVSYSIAERAVMAVFLAVNVASYPMLLRAFERHGREGAQEQARENAEIMITIALPAWGGFTIASTHIATVLVGADYTASAAQMMPLIGLAIFLCGLRSHYFSHALHITRSTWGFMIATVPAALINIVLNVILLPRVGLMGAVWSSIIAYFFGLIISVWQSYRTFPMPIPLRETLKALAATIVMCAVIRLISFPHDAIGLMSLMATGGLIYAVLTLLFDIGGMRRRTVVAWQKIRPEFGTARP